MAEKKRRTRAPVKRRYKGRVTAQPLPTIPTLTVPMNPIPPAALTHTVVTSTATTQMPTVKPVAMSILVTIQFGTGKIWRNFLPHRKAPNWRNPSAPAAIHPNKGHNLKLYPVSQPSSSEKTPVGLTPYQPPQICSKPG